MISNMNAEIIINHMRIQRTSGIFSINVTRTVFLNNASDEKFTLLCDQSTLTFLFLGIFRASGEMKNGVIGVQNLVERFFEEPFGTSFDPLTGPVTELIENRSTNVAKKLDRDHACYTSTRMSAYYTPKIKICVKKF